MNFLIEFFNKHDKNERTRISNERIFAVMEKRERENCLHTIVVHTNNDGFYRHQCTKCGNVMVTPIQTIADARG